MYDKSQKQQQILNPCNKFIIQYLIKLRQQDNNSKFIKTKFRFDHQYQIYTRAINSIKKYPMPIICQDQLNTISGIGDCLSKKLIVVIKEYYKRFLKQKNQLPEKLSSAYNIQASYQSKSVNWKQQKSCSSMKSDGSENQIQENQEDENISEKRDKISMLLYRNKNLSECDSKSSRSENLLKRVNEYRPRQGTQSANVLRILKILQADTQPVSKKDIDKCLLENGYDKTKQWKNCKEQLQKNGYISVDQAGKSEVYSLTSKGLQYVQSQQQLEQSNYSKKKMQLSIDSFKLKYLSKEKEQLTNSQSQAFSINQASQSKSNTKSVSMQQLIDPGFYKKKLIKTEDERLSIIIDTRQMKDQGEKSFFQEALAQKYQLSVMTQALTIGDFVFCYNGQILDYVIERKKADDLASSIIDGRYKQQKYRLKNSGASSIIYLYQGHPSQSSALREKQLENALMKTRVNDGFKVVKTSKINQTVKFLANLYQEVNKKIRNGEELDTIGSLQQFNRRNAKNRYLTVENVFGFGLKSLPNVGKQTVTNIMRYFKSFHLLYKQLEPLGGNQDRMEFLNGLLKGGRTQSGVTNLIVQLLFSTQYAKSTEKCYKEQSLFDK